jgi:hypothetical protein
LDFRHEWKHVINAADMMELRARLRAVCQTDAHAVDGKYLIRSLYFDTPTDQALREKLDGVCRREKFRIRCYNGDYSIIHLEKKSKYDGLGQKAKARLTVPEMQALLRGETEWMLQGDRPLLEELYCKMKNCGLQPKTIVDYTREPFIYGPGNVRVTLDYNIRSGVRCIDFLDPDCPTLPVQDDPIILEVKWDAFLPSVIRDAVQLRDRRTSSYSKYAACRVYG